MRTEMCFKVKADFYYIKHAYGHVLAIVKGLINQLFYRMVAKTYNIDIESTIPVI